MGVFVREKERERGKERESSERGERERESTEKGERKRRSVRSLLKNIALD